MRALALVLLSLLPHAARASEPWPDWMAGSWCGSLGKARVEEIWLRPAGGLMLGMSRTVGMRGAQFELMRVQLQEGKPVLWAQPQGGTAVVFAMREQGAQHLEFHNPTHDFPQSIRYQREGERLLAEIAGTLPNGQLRRIRFEYQACALNG